MQGRLEWKESMGKVRMAMEGPRGSPTSIPRSLPRSDAQQPSFQVSTGSLQGILQETQGFLQEGCAILQDDWPWKFWKMVKGWSGEEG